MVELTRRGVAALIAAPAIGGSSDPAEGSIAAIGAPVRANAYGSVVQAQEARISQDIKLIWIDGYFAPGDHGDGFFERVDKNPRHGGFRSQDRFLPDGSSNADHGGWWGYVPGPTGVNVKAFGARGDGKTLDTAALQNALDYLRGLANAGSVVSHGGGRIYLPPGDYLTRTLSLKPGCELNGAGMDASRLIGAPELKGPILQVVRPAAIRKSYTRRYAVRDLALIGNGELGCTGLRIARVAELTLERLEIERCDIGVDFEMAIAVTMAAVKISSSITNGLRATNGCNGYDLHGCRIGATRRGANIRIEGGHFQGFGWQLTNCIIESALDELDGVGILVGATHPVQGVVISGCYFENNRAAAVQVGSETASNYSDVEIVGGFFTKGATGHGYAIRVVGGRLRLFGGYLEGFGPDRTVHVAHTRVSKARVISLGTLPSGPARTGPDLLAFHDGVLRIGAAIRIEAQDGEGLAITADRAETRFSTGGSAFHFAGAPLSCDYAGSVTLSASSAEVRFDAPLPDNRYAIVLTSDNNRVRWSGKTVNGFTICGSSGDTVDWFVVRHS